MPEEPLPGGHPAPAAATCPICHRPSDVVLRPFCSKRCADIDLHRWLTGSYRIPAEDEPDEAEDGTSSPGPGAD